MKELKIARYETVKLAAQKGFDWIESDDKFYDVNSKKLDWTFQGYQENVTECSRYPAPSLELLRTWLREDLGIFVTVHIHKKGFSYNVERIKGKYGIEMLASSIPMGIAEDTWSPTYEDALERAINTALKL